ncbi:DUF3391 domain-containing protein [Aquincola tertiaricarbonis]|uniref:DUF3391 domain-containing protein n=2 Tax=Aquincola tertiaricarbonis TaxID=391953 RepID=A0ABY4S4F7_AQUTE|nr:DUF3391 domain-containing protein [Aquincola tertiaricarbonis]
MHLHAFDSSWVRHPFWKSRFVLTDPDDLRAAHGSGINECWIDTSLGLDVGTSRSQPLSHPSQRLTSRAQPPLRALALHR